MGKKSEKNRLRLQPKDVHAGMLVKKLSGNPFKYGGKTGTVAEVVESPYTGQPAVRIAEDESIVNIYMLGAAELFDEI